MASYSREIIYFAADQAASNLLGIPLDLRPLSLAAWAATYATKAEAPTLHIFDAEGHMIPTPGRTVSQEERDWYDEYNRNLDNAIRNRNQAVDDFLKDIAPRVPINIIDQECNRNYGEAKNPPRRDPLVIDLDRDGIETIGVVGGAPILFDHNADGIKTGTGWVKSDDAWLVMDRNGNGTVDSGQELFGVDTQIIDAGGVQRNAFSGFEALGALDTNNDKVFDAQDAAFNQVRLWQDFNQDGISQANELSTLTQKNIISISLVNTNAGVDLGNGNAVTGTATVTFSNQTTTHIDSVAVSGAVAGNLDLANNPFYREFTDAIPLTEAARALPEMGGSGWARDLREAMSQGTAAAQTLTSTVNAFAQASTRAAQLSLIDALLADWATSTGKHDLTPSLIEGVTETLVNESGNTKTYRVAAMDPAQLQALLNGNSNADYSAARFVINDEAYAKKPGYNQAMQLTEAGAELMRRRAVLEVFNGQRFIDFTAIRTTSSGGGGAGSGGGGGGGGGGMAAEPIGPQVRYEVQITTAQIDSLNRAYEVLRESVYKVLVKQTRLDSYLNNITFTLDERGMTFDASPLVAMLSSRKSADAANALTDLIELNRYSFETLSAVGVDSIALLRTWISDFSAQPWLASTLADLRVNLGTSTTLSSSADLYLGLDRRDTVYGGDGNDLIDAGAGADYVNADAGQDTLLGGAGNDILYGGNGADVLQGGADNDTLYGEAGADVLDGGTGNDYLSGGDGQDTYRFGRGSGQDTIYNYDSDTLGTSADVIQLGDGITASDIELRRSGDTLVIAIAGTNDQLQVQNYFSQDGQSAYAVETIRFANGTQLSIDQVKALLLTPGQQTSVNQTGYATADLLVGGAGRDTLDGRGGNDTIHGAAGSDYLVGGDGQDKLQGGSDNDLLYGGNGNDLLQGDSRPEKVVISAKASLAGGVGAELQLWINGQKVGSAEVRSTSGWADYTFDVDLPQGRDVSLDVVFANDATVNGEDRNLWINTVRVGSHVMNPTDTGVKVDRGNGAGAFDGLDVIAGSGGLFWNAALRFTVPLSVVGSGGNDSLYGDAGNDTLDGGAGNDSLSGGDGADVYLFSRGDGQDSINNHDADALGVNADMIQLGAGITVTDVVLTRSSSDLIISIKGTDDQLRVSSYFYQDAASAYVAESIKFADGTAWDIATVKAKVLTSTTGHDNLTGYATADSLSGDEGHDTLNGEAGNDTLDGGVGQDSLNGGNGADVLKGGLGHDTLYGGNDADSLQGNEHNDYLYGDAGNDTLDGGTGNDNLQGGNGADVYRFGRGSGQDTIFNYDTDTLGTNADVIELGAGVLTTDVVLTRSSDDLVIRINGTTDQLVVQSYFYQDGTAPYALETLKFADGTTWDIAVVKGKVLVSTTGNDSLAGYATADSLSGGDGSDTVNGLAGNDTLDGGAGQDTLSGGDGADVLKGGLGNDTLYGGNDADSLQGNEHNDYLYGDAGNDTLDGGTGTDYLSGGNGADVYRFGRGSGQDTLYNHDSDALGTNADVIELGAGVLTTDLVLTRNSDDLVIRINGTTDQVVVQSYFYLDGASSYALETLKFADGTTWDIAAVKTKVLANTTGNDSLTGYATADSLSGGDGNDVLSGLTGNDTLDGGVGHDNLNGGDGADVLKGGLGRDTLYGGNDADSLQGNEHNDYLYGDAGSDTLDGGSGNDNLQGGNGADVYRFGRGGGQDTIYNHDADALGTNADVIELGAGVLATDVVLTRSSDDLVISISGTDDKLVVQSYFYLDGTAAYTVENLKFADGTTWNYAAVKSRLSTSTTPAGVAQYGTGVAEALTGGAGPDTLSGGAGNDTLNGGAGNDNLQGDGGNDTYLFGKGSGKDTIYNYDTTAGKLDVVQLGTGVTTADVVLTRSSDDLLLSIKGTSDSLRINSYFHSDATYGYQVEQIKFADGTIWDVAAVKSKLVIATADNDVLTGYATADSLTGLAGDDALYGRAGNDTLDGGAGEDSLSGEDGDDLLRGGTENDILSGDAGNDSLLGQDGDDNLAGGSGHDTLDGGAGNDYLSGDAGNDVFIFGRGYGRDTVSSYDSTAGKTDVVQLGTGIAVADVVLTRSSDDLLLSIKGTSDSLRISSYFYSDAASGYPVEQIKFVDGTIWNVATVKSKVIVATEDHDALTGYASADSLTGLAGNDTLYGRAGNDTLDGGAGDDGLSGEAGDDVLRGGTQNDTLYGDAGNDSLLGQEGDDYVIGGAGNDTLDGGVGNDFLSGEAGNDIFVFGKGYGRDTISSYDSAAGKTDVVQLGAGITAADVVLTRSGDALVLLLKGSADSLRIDSYFYNDATYGYQVEQIKFADGTTWDVAAVKAKAIVATDDHDVLTGYATADSLTGLGGDDTLYGRAGNDTLDGGAGEDRLYGEEDDDVLRGGTQNDTLFGDAGSDSLLGQDGDDVLYGGAGNDTLDGGAGNDQLQGEAGNDTYLFGKGSGKDTIYNYDTTAGKQDVVQLGAGITAADVVLTRSSDDLLLSIKGTSDSLRISNYFYNDATYGYQVEQIKFADGTAWDVAAVKSKVALNTVGNDALIGLATADSLTGQAGDDVLYGRAGNDTLDGGSGEDRLYGEDGDDLLRGGTQNDTLYGDAGNDSLLGQDGDDHLSGGSGNDTLDGGAGNDTLQADAGNDTYVFGKGSGKDTINNYDGTAGKQDVVQLGAGITVADVVLTRSSDDLLLSIKGSSDSLRISSYFYSDATYGYQVEQIKFADGTTWDIAAVKSIVTAGTTENDVLTGYAMPDSLTGLAGDDALYGRAGNDTLDGGAGEDSLSGEDGDDLLRGGAQNDTLYGDAGNDSLLGQEGDDNLSGGAGNDTLDGGAGNDSLQGGVGNDTYLFGKGHGRDTISSYDGTVGKLDAIRLGSNVAVSDVILNRDGDSLVIGFTDATDTLRVDSFFYNNAAGGYQIEQIVFSNGTVWDLATIKSKVSGATSGDDIIVLPAGDDAINGLAGHDSISGGAGNDTVNGGEGNDTLVGGTGNDALIGGTGNDTFVFAKGAGVDRINEGDSTAGNVDTVSFTDVKSTEVTAIERKGDHLLIKYGTVDQVTVENQFNSDMYEIEQIKFSDGVTWNEAAIKSRVITHGDASNNTISGYADGGNRIYGFDGHDSLYGAAQADTLDGGAGDDYLSGDVGNDNLLGGAGNDTLYGGQGLDTLVGGVGDDSMRGHEANDTYVLAKGAGTDSIYDYDTAAGNIDVVSFTDVKSTEVTAIERLGDHLVIKYGTSDQVTIENQFSGDAYEVEQIKFSDGITWNEAAIKSRVITKGDAGNNTISGYTDGGNRIYGLDGNDYLYGAGQADTLDGGAGDDYLSGDVGNDSVLGGEGNDTLHGGQGLDTLVGGVGNDSMRGQEANDTYVLAKGAGIDSIYDYDTVAGNIDAVSFTDVKSTEVTAIERLGDHLVIKYGTSDQVTIENQFSGDAYEVEQIKFSDGVTWNEAAIKSRVITKGDAGNNTISGYTDGGNRIHGLDGNDYLYGAGFADTLEGGAGNDWLSGAAGLDYLRGGDGNDTLNGGDDTDFLYGLNNDDSIIGGTGYDAIWGGKGNDTLAGGADGDVYFFNPGDGSDQITDYDTVAGNSDAIVFSVAINSDQLWFRKTGTSLTDLEISVIGTVDKVVVKDWFSGAAYQIEEMQAGDGKFLSNANVLNLVNAMAQFTPPAAGQTTLPANYQASLTPVIAANWVAT